MQVSINACWFEIRGGVRGTLPRAFGIDFTGDGKRTRFITAVAVDVRMMQMIEYKGCGGSKLCGLSSVVEVEEEKEEEEEEEEV
jgi:hypothetical protein